MSGASDFDIDHVARLARIALTPEEKARFAAQIGDVIGHIAQLQKVDVAGVEPTAHAFPITNIFRQDVPAPALPPEAALRNAPSARESMFVVPKVVE